MLVSVGILLALMVRADENVIAFWDFKAGGAEWMPKYSTAVPGARLYASRTPAIRA